MGNLGASVSTLLGIVGVAIATWFAISLSLGSYFNFRKGIPVMRATVCQGIALWIAVGIVLLGSTSVIHIWWLAPLAFLVGSFVAPRA